MSATPSTNPLDAFWADRLKRAATDLSFEQPDISAALKDLHPDQAKAVRILLEGSYCAGYYHDGYTHDSAYSSMKATECADEMLQYAGLPVDLIDQSKATHAGPFDHDRTNDEFDAAISNAIFAVIGHKDLRNGGASLKESLRGAIAGLYSQAAQAATLNEDYNDVLRSLAFSLSAGGYNSDGLIAPKIAEEKIRWGIDYLVKGACDIAVRRAASGQPSTDVSPVSTSADNFPPEGVSRLLYEANVTVDAQVLSCVPDNLLKELQAYAVVPSRANLISVLGLIVEHTADLRADLARARQRPTADQAEIDALTIASEYLRDVQKVEATLLHKVIAAIIDRLRPLEKSNASTTADTNARLERRDDLRRFGLRVGYEVAGFVLPTDDQPDVEVIVDLILASEEGAGTEMPSSLMGAKAASKNPDAYMVIQPNGEPSHLFFQRANAEQFIEGRAAGYTIDPLARTTIRGLAAQDSLDGEFLLRHLLAMREVIANDAYASTFLTTKDFRNALLVVFDGSSLDLNGDGISTDSLA